MSESIVSFLRDYGLSPEITVFFISMLPIIELRGGIVAARLLGLPLIEAYVVCFFGNMLPVPFILLFIKRIFRVLKRFRLTRGIVLSLERSAARKSAGVARRQLLGLFVFVALPLPGTGAWTGSLIASILGVPIKKAFAAITVGVLCAGLIMITLSYFIPGLFGF